MATSHLSSSPLPPAPTPHRSTRPAPVLLHMISHPAARAGRQAQNLLVLRATSSPAQPPPAPAAPSPFLRVVLPSALTLMLCNMDRICLSVAILPMSKEMAWPASMQGVVQSAFLYGYMATQLLGGALADKYGGKLVMAAGILWFSSASLLLPLAASEPVRAAGWTIPAVLAARCMVGLGEGVTLPAMNTLISRHIPEGSKVRALGMAFSGFHSGNLLGLLLSPVLLAHFGWRGLFVIFGMLGAPALAMWMAAVPDKAPTKHPAAEAAAAAAAAAAEAAAPGCSGSALFPAGCGQTEFRVAGASNSATGASYSSADASNSATGASNSAANASNPSRSWRPASEIGIRELLSHPATWAIIIVNMVNHWGYFIYLNWMPTYFNAALGFDLRASSLCSFLPWLAMALGSSGSALLSDALVARGVPVAAVRRRLQTLAFLAPALALLLLVQPGLRPGPAVAAMTLALSSTSLGLAGYVANMSDIAPNHAGLMYGLCSTFGSAAGIAGVTAVGFIVEATGSFGPAFMLTAGLYVLGTVVWNVMCVGERVF